MKPAHQWASLRHIETKGGDFRYFGWDTSEMMSSPSPISLFYICFTLGTSNQRYVVRIVQRSVQEDRDRKKGPNHTEEVVKE